jgi:ribosomal silencing factor RsfS
MYLEKARIANKSGQKTLVLDIKDAVALSDSLAVVMTRLTGQLEELIAQSQRTQPQEEVIQVSMDGGGFR